jgi:inhibitor of KinA sporulation pathway (predicted exonuclease)
MTTYHAVVRVDHHQAEILQFDAEHVEAGRVKAHSHATAQHGSEVRSVHEFFAHVCDALAGIPEVLVTGSKTGLADFRHYVEKHRPALAPQIAGWEAVDHPTDKQLVALARQYFLKHDRMSGVPTPT